MFQDFENFKQTHLREMKKKLHPNHDFNFNFNSDAVLIYWKALNMCPCAHTNTHPAHCIAFINSQ